LFLKEELAARQGVPRIVGLDAVLTQVIGGPNGQRRPTLL